MGANIVIFIHLYAKKSEIPKKVSQLTNDSGYLTIESVGDFLSNNKYVTEEMLSDEISGLMEGYVVDNDYVHTDNNFSDSDKIGFYYSFIMMNYIYNYIYFYFFFYIIIYNILFFFNYFKRKYKSIFGKYSFFL